MRSPEERAAVERAIRKLRDRNGAKTLDGIVPPTSYEADYYRKLVAPVDEMNAAVEEILFPFLEKYEDEYVDKPIPSYLPNALPPGLKGVLLEQLKRLGEVAQPVKSYGERVAGDMAGKSSAYHRAAFAREVRKKMGINIVDLMSENGVADQIRKVTKDNVDLITKLPGSYYERVTKTVLSSVTEGNDFASLRSLLMQDYGIERRKAKLIAVDQVGKFFGNLSRIRQQNEGIHRYQWDANSDARTRSTHKENDGEVFEWGDSSPGKAKGRPGEEVRCRCVGRPVIEEGAFQTLSPRTKTGL